MTETKTEELYKNLLVLFVSIGLLFLSAYVTLCMWRWFVVPLGAPSIGYAHAYGLSLMAAFHTRSPLVKKETDDHAKNVWTSLSWVLLVWAIAAVVHWGMR